MIGTFVSARSIVLCCTVQGWVAMEEPELIVVGQDGQRYFCDKTTKYVVVDNPPQTTKKVRALLQEYSRLQNGV